MTDGDGGPPRPTPRSFEDQPTGAVPVERKPGAMPKGARNTIIVVAAVVVAATLSALFGYFVLADKAENETAAPLGSSDCSLISDGDLSRALGAKVDGFEFGAVVGAAPQSADNRVALGGTGCLASSGEVDVFASLSSKESDDAEQQFATQLASAKAGNAGGQPYFAQDVPDLGDEAFCTTPGAMDSVGVLARSGDQLVYTTVTAPTLAPTPEAGCDLAAKLAQAVLDA